MSDPTQPSDEVTTIADLRRMMREFVAEREWGKYHTPRNLAASVSVEAGELLELFQWATAEEAIERLRTDEQFCRAVTDEMSDVLMYLMSLANAMDVDLAVRVFEKMARNRKKYPSEAVKGHYQRPLPEV